MLRGSLVGTPGLWASTISVLPEEFVHSTSWVCPGYSPGIGHRPRTLHDLPGGRGELGEGQLAGQWVPGQVLGSSDDLAAVWGDDGAEAEEDVADLPVHVVPGCPVARPPQNEPAGRLQAAAGCGGVQQPEVDDVPRHPLLERERAAVRGPGQQLTLAARVVGHRSASWPRPLSLRSGGHVEDLDRRSARGGIAE